VHACTLLSDPVLKLPLAVSVILIGAPCPSVGCCLMIVGPHKGSRRQRVPDDVAPWADVTGSDRVGCEDFAGCCCCGRVGGGAAVETCFIQGGGRHVGVRYTTG
jgi:hypothetical protein